MPSNPVRPSPLTPRRTNHRVVTSPHDRVRALALHTAEHSPQWEKNTRTRCGKTPTRTARAHCGRTIACTNNKALLTRHVVPGSRHLRTRLDPRHPARARLLKYIRYRVKKYTWHRSTGYKVHMTQSDTLQGHNNNNNMIRLAAPMGLLRRAHTQAHTGLQRGHTSTAR